MSSSRSRAGSLPDRSFPPNGDHFRNRPGWRTRVVKMLDAPTFPSSSASSSAVWASASPDARGGMRGVVGRGAVMARTLRPGVNEFHERAKAGTMDPMPRPIWSGSISFGLVNIPVKLYTAVSAARPCGSTSSTAATAQRIRYRKVIGRDGEEVPDDAHRQGLRGLQGPLRHGRSRRAGSSCPRSSRTIDIEEFVDLADIDPLFYDSPYYLAPDKDAQALCPAWPRRWRRRARSASPAS